MIAKPTPPEWREPAGHQEQLWWWHLPPNGEGLPRIVVLDNITQKTAQATVGIEETFDNVRQRLINSLSDHERLVSASGTMHQ